MSLVSRQFWLSRSRTLRYLGELEAAGGTGKSLYVPPGLPSRKLGNLVAKALEPEPIPPELVTLAASSSTGAALFWGPSRRCLIVPPLPIAVEHLTEGGYLVEPLCSLLSQNHKIALILVRLGAYAIGLAEGETLLASKVGTGLVHGRHKKGGSSQQRFRRHREKQIETFLNRACLHIHEKLEPYASTTDFIVYGGAQTTILLLRKQCPFLARFNDRILLPLLDIPEPRQPVLEKAVGRIWSSRIIEWHNDKVLL